MCVWLITHQSFFDFSASTFYISSVCTLFQSGIVDLPEIQNMTCEGLYSNISNELLNLTEAFQNKINSNFVEVCKDFTSEIRLFNVNLRVLDKCILSNNESSNLLDSAERLMFQFNLCQEMQAVFWGTFQSVDESISHRHWAEWIWGIFWLLFIEIVGNGCLFATFVYERFGMDPQKRTVINQLLSQCCWTIMVFNITSLPIVISRRLFGPLASAFAIWFIINARLYVCMISLLLSELMILKCMYICKWSVMAMKDDNLISSVILRTNILLSSLITMQTTMLDDGTCNWIYKTITGENEFRLPTETCSISLQL